MIAAGQGNVPSGACVCFWVYGVGFACRLGQLDPGQGANMSGREVVSAVSAAKHSALEASSCTCGEANSRLIFASSVLHIINDLLDNHAENSP